MMGHERGKNGHQMGFEAHLGKCVVDRKHFLKGRIKIA